MKFQKPLPATFEELMQISLYEAGDCDPTTWVVAWNVRWNIREHELPTLEESFREGNKAAPLVAVTRCLEFDVPIPEWASTALVAARCRVDTFETGSWDEVFGKPHRKGTHLAARRKELEKRPRVYIDVLNAVEAGRAIDEALFEEVGRRHAIGKTLAAEFYYAEKHEVDSF